MFGELMSILVAGGYYVLNEAYRLNEAQLTS
jgi:hypothetical protein